MIRVKIREEQGKYLVYFPDSRRIVEVNAMGALILDLLFNKEMDREDIRDKTAKEYDTPITEIETDIATFLAQIGEELQPDGFNVIEQEQLSVPLGVELEITTSCNLSCKHCFQKNHNGASMSTEKVKNIISTLAKNNVFEISLLGGEPFKHDGLMEILEYCQNYDMAINLVTNGTFINKDIAKTLSNIKRLVLLVSLDGTENTHNRIRGNGVFKKVDCALKNLSENGCATEIICTLNAINISSYKEVIEYCATMNIPCNFSLFKPFKPEHTDLILNNRDFFEAIIYLLTLRRDKGYQIGISNAAIVSELLGLPTRNECRATRSGMVINIKGQMLTCPSLTAAGYYTEEELPFFDENFTKAWKENPIFQKFRENGLRECQARSYIFSKNVKGYDPYGITAFRNRALIS